MKKISKAVRMALPLLAAAIATQAGAQIGDDRLCADQNADGMVTPTDFTAWISNYNSNNPIADVNQDGSVTPTDFTAWISAFNQGEDGPGCTVDLGDGGSVTGSISYVGDVDTFTVTARAGDDLLFSIDERNPSSGSLEVSLYDPDGLLVRTDYESDGFRLDVYDIAATGTYTYVVEEAYGNYTVDYNFTVVVADDKVDPDDLAISSGAGYTASLTPGDIDTYTISATAGDDLFFSIDEDPTSSASLYVTLHGPNGELLRSDWESNGFRLDHYDAAATGRYTYIIRDYYGEYETDYTFTAVVADGIPDDDSIELISGQAVSGSIGLGDIDTYNIDANAGDDLFLSIDETPTAGTSLYITLHGPNGELITSDWESNGMRIDVYNLPSSGTYTYVIRDYYGQYTGSYTLTSVVADGSVNADNVSLTSGQTVSASMDLGDIDTFTINATAGNDLFLTIDETPTADTSLIVTLHGPNGELIASDWESNGMRIDVYNLPSSGTYTYVIRDYYGQYTGNYTLTSVVADDTIDADNVALTSGMSVSASIDLGDIDTFTINAKAGDDLFLTIDETPTADTSLYVTLHGPNGELITSDWESNGMRIDTYDLPATGTYTYVIRDYYGQYTGDYTLTSVVADDTVDAGNVALSSGQSVSGSIELGDIDTFTINAAAGQDLLFTIAETPTSGISYLVSVHGPNGQLLDLDWSSSGYNLNVYNVPATGRYTYIVRDYYGQYVGNYTLSATVAN